MRRIKRFNYRFASKFNQLEPIVISMELDMIWRQDKMNLAFPNYCKDFGMPTLDFSVKTLLIYALKAEAQIVKQHFPRATRSFARDGAELLFLDEQYDLLKTGVGLSQTRKALEMLPDPNTYRMIIHFGVSGSLADALSIQSIISSHHFTARGQDTLTLKPTSYQLPGIIEGVIYYSSEDAVMNESSRNQAKLGGATAVDMESYTVAEFCLKHQIELLALRCISDRAGNTSAVDFRQHFNQASSKLQNYLIKNIIKV